MSVGRAMALIGLALHPGADLSPDADHLSAVDALAALGSMDRKEPGGRALLHARLAGMDVAAFRVVTAEMTALVWDRHPEWALKDRRKMTAGETLQAFVEQVSDEFLNRICDTCAGHGVMGAKLDTVRHSLGKCQTCRGRGRVDYWPRSMLDLLAHGDHDGQVAKPMKTACPTCLGKRVVAITEAVKAGRLKSCPRCAGTGVAKATNRQRGRVLHCDHRHVARVWNERFTEVLIELRKLQARALYECAEYLR